jgi:muramoyltetrapeptide carboxypeptidase LdcA involved in peptidoglycan recycling
MPHTLASPEWLRDNPAARAADLMQAFADPAIAGVFASIGGDDAIRLIPHLDIGVLRAHPKLFIGYSDTTALLFACLKSGFSPLHGPSVMSGFAENAGISQSTANSFERAAFSPNPLGFLTIASEGWTDVADDWTDTGNQQQPRRRQPSQGLRCLRGTGSVTGRLLGGCAEVLEMLKDTPWWPPLHYWDGAILIYETSEEAPSDAYVLRWLRNFNAQGILPRLNGLLLGRPGGQMTADQRHRQEQAVLKALDEAGLANLPVIADADIGHTDPILSLPLGALATLHCTQPSVEIQESATAV